jgi:hypothetical protein
MGTRSGPRKKDKFPMFEQKEALRAMTKHLPEREQKKRELSELN